MQYRSCRRGPDRVRAELLRRIGLTGLLKPGKQTGRYLCDNTL
jgi:hypothetical protein